jgi:hypothetical protein
MMRHSTRILRRSRRAWPWPARTAAAVIATAVLALLAACGGGPSAAGSGGSPNAGGSATFPSAVAYSACMRSHGVPNYPDPSSNESLPKGNAQAFGVSNSQFQAARTACRNLLSDSETFTASLTQCLETGDCPQAVVQQALTEGRKFAQCMHNHGVPNWPDPTIDSTGRPSFNVTGAGISIASTRSSQMLSKIGHCQNQPGAVLLRQE